MKMKKTVMDVYSALINNEELLRLLVYPSKTIEDSPLSNDKEDVLKRDDRFELFRRHIIRTNRVDDLEPDKLLTRLCVYPGRKETSRGRNVNQGVASQHIIFDIYCNHEQDDIDLRLSQIDDQIDSIINKSRVTGIKEIDLVYNDIIPNAPKGYAGRKLVYKAVKAR